MAININQEKVNILKKILKKIKPKFSFHYVAYTSLFLLLGFSVVTFVTATTPNPGHAWGEIGDGVFAVTYNQTATRTYTFPDANATVLTTNALVTVAQGGTGANSITGLVKGNGTSAFTAAVAGTDYQAPLVSGTNIKTINGSSILGSGDLTVSGMVYPSSGIAVSTGSAWGTSLTAPSGALVGTTDSQNLTNKTYNGLTLTSNSTGFAVAGGTTSKTLTVSNTLTLTGTDGSTLNIGAGGTLGTGAYATIANYVPYTGATGAVTLGANTLSTTSGLISPKLYPAANSTTAIQFNKADGTTNIMNIDTTNNLVGIGTSSPTYRLDVRGYSASGGGIRSAMGFDIYQVPDPTAPTGVVSAGGSVDTGTHYYAVTYVTGVGETHAVFSGIITTTAGNNTVTLTIPTSSDERVTARKIYRTKVGQEEYQDYYLATVANNTSTTYVDTAADSTLTGTEGASYFRMNTTSNNLSINSVKSLVLDSQGVFLGQFAGASVTTGGGNVFIGHTTGQNNTTGTYNTYVGNQTAMSTTTGIRNTVLGTYALSSNTTTSYNTAIGPFSLYASTGSANTAVGESSLNRLVTGNNNVALGKEAGSYQADEVTDLTGTANSIYIGAYAKGLNNSDVNSIVVGFDAIGKGANTAVWGNTSTTQHYFSGSLSLTGSTPTARLTLPAGTATANTAPLKLTAGTNLSTTEAGAIEYDGTHLYFTASNGGTRYQLDQQGGSTNWDTIGDPSGDGSVAMGSTSQSMDWGTATTQTALSLTGASLTTGKLLSLSSNSLTSGSVLDISSNGTGALTGQKGLNISLTGANATSAQTTYGAYISNTHTGSGTKIGLYSDASGGGLSNPIAGSFNTTASTMSGGYVSGTGLAVNVTSANSLDGSVYGINVGSLTSAGSSTIEYGIIVGSNWDYDIYSSGSKSYFAGKIGIGQSSPTALLHLKSGTATAGTAPLKLTAGTNLSTTEAGAIEYDGTHLYFTASNGGTRYQLDQQSGGGLTVGTSTITSGNSGRVLYNNAGVLGEMTTTGSGTVLALATTPTFTTNITTPLVLGGTGTTQSLTFQTTSGIGATGADMHFLVGNNGGTEALTILNSGYVGIGTNAPTAQLEIKGLTTEAVLSSEKVTNGTFDTDLSSWTATTWTAGTARANYTGTTGPIAASSVILNDGGTGYTNGDVLTLTNGANDATITVTGVSSGRITSFTQTSNGTANSVNSSVSVTGGTGVGANFSIVKLADSTNTLSQNVSVTGGNTYQVTYTVNRTGGELLLTLGGVQGHSVRVIGTYTQVITAINTGNLIFTPTVDFSGSIDSISVKQITPTSSSASFTNSNGSSGVELRSGGASLYNTFVGYQSGINNVSGNRNSAFGYQSLISNTSGSRNSAFGYQSLYFNTTGNYNTANGYQSLYYNTSGSNNTSNGYYSLLNNISGSYNTANGYASLYSNTTGNYNTANGYYSLRGNTTGVNNTANGYQSLYSNTSGTSNTANGYSSLYYNTTGFSNTANGYQSLYYNTTGSNNVADGYSSLYSNTTGSSNTALGVESLYGITTTSNNTALGYRAGRYITNGSTANTTSSNSLYLGYDTRASADGDSNEIVIGYQAIGNGSNTATIGNSSILRTYLTGVNLKAGTATAGTAPLKLTAGTNLSTTEAGAIEYDGTHLYFTASNGGTRYQLDQQSAGAGLTVGGSVITGGSSGRVLYNNSGTLGEMTTTGSGTVLALATTPTFTTNITTPLVLGGTGTTQSLTFQTTSGIGDTGADMHFLVGNNGSVEAMTILNSGNIGLGTLSPGTNKLSVIGDEYVSGNVGIGIGPGTMWAAPYALEIYKSDQGFAVKTDLTTSSTSGRAFSVNATGDTYSRGMFYSDGTYGVGPGSGTRDVFLSRSTTGTFRISGSFSGPGDNTGSANLIVNGNIGIGSTSTTARLTLPAGTATANTAPLKLTAGTNLSTTEAGAIEYDGTHLYFTASNGGTRYQLDQQSGGVSIGGSISGGSSGSILFVNSSSQLAQNNTSLNWNDSTSLLTLGGDIILNTQKDLRFADSDSTNWVAFQAPAIVTTNTTWTLPASDPTGGGCFKSDGSGNMSISACGDTNVQTFASNGNYVIPTDALMVITEAWGGGGGGGGGYAAAVGTIRTGGAGGGGGAYNTQTILASTLGSAGASVPVTIGTGGTAGTATAGTSQDGGAGGRTCLSSSSSCGGTVYLSAYGGGGGNGGSSGTASGGGGGGGSLSVGLTNSTAATGGAGGGPGGGAAASPGGSSSGFGGAAGATAAASATTTAGGAAQYGGGGGGATYTTGAGNSGPGGSSYKGGAGGGAGGSIATTYTLRTGGAGGSNVGVSGGGGAAGAATEGAAGTAGSAGVNGRGGFGGGGGTTGSAVAGGAGGAGGARGGGGGGGGASNTTTGSAGGVGGNGYLIAWTLRGSGADLAEVYGSNDNTMVPGDVVSLDKEMKAGVKKSSKAYDKDTIGVISTNPGLTIGSVEDPGATPVLVALSGRVPVKVNMENGEIKKGDYLTPSSVPGVAMKATKAGTIIGQAMTEYTDPEAPGYVVAFIKSGPSNGVKLTEVIPGLVVDPVDESSGNQTITTEEEMETENVDTITDPKMIQKLALAYFLDQKIELEKATDISEIYTDRLSAALEVITPTVITDTLMTNSIMTSTGEVISFNSEALFNVPPIFNSDTAGFAIIKEGERSVDITFDEPYISEPVVSANMAFSVLDNLDLSSIGNLFDNDIKNLIVNTSNNGFTILINRDAPRDIRFSWTALSVKDPKVFESVVDGLIFDDLADESNDISSNNTESIEPPPEVPPAEEVTTSGVESELNNSSSTQSTQSSEPETVESAAEELSTPIVEEPSIPVVEEPSIPAAEVEGNVSSEESSATN